MVKLVFAGVTTYCLAEPLVGEGSFAPRFCCGHSCYSPGPANKDTCVCRVGCRLFHRNTTPIEINKLRLSFDLPTYFWLNEIQILSTKVIYGGSKPKIKTPHLVQEAAIRRISHFWSLSAVFAAPMCQEWWRFCELFFCLLEQALDSGFYLPWGVLQQKLVFFFRGNRLNWWFSQLKLEFLTDFRGRSRNARNARGFFLLHSADFRWGLTPKDAPVNGTSTGCLFILVWRWLELRYGPLKKSVGRIWKGRRADIDLKLQHTRRAPPRWLSWLRFFLRLMKHVTKLV